jgi:hypothetical protein
MLSLSQIGTATHLGFGEIDLATLEPFETIERDFPIRHEKGHDQGTMSVRMLFQPESKFMSIRQAIIPG